MIRPRTFIENFPSAVAIVNPRPGVALTVGGSAGGSAANARVARERTNIERLLWSRCGPRKHVPCHPTIPARSEIHGLGRHGRTEFPFTSVTDLHPTGRGRAP